jgi:hypothetical protein
MEQNYTLSLSRWHKIAERLSREYTEAVNAAREAFNTTTVPAYLGESQKVQLRERGQAMEARLEWAFRIQDAIAAIRKALGDANAQAGVTRELADHDRLSRRHRLLTTLLEGQTADLVDIDQLEHVPENFGMDVDRYDRRPSGIRVRIMSRERHARLVHETDEVRTEVYALADRISEMNRAPLTLPLPADVARAAGI